MRSTRECFTIISNSPSKETAANYNLAEPPRKPFKDKYKYPFHFYTRPNSFDEYEIHSIPTTYIRNSKNEILYNKVGDIDWNKTKY